MPFKSSKQRAYLFARKPEVAEKFAEHGGKEKKKHQVNAVRKMLK